MIAARLLRTCLGRVGARVAALAAFAAAAGCRTDQTLVTPDPHLERMLDQPKALAYGESPLLPHGMAMQTPPEGTLPFAGEAPAGEALRPEVVTTGWEHGEEARAIPIPVDRALLERGRARFGVFCATCHGELGDGASPVAAWMALRKPQNLVTLTDDDARPGHVFRVVREGYGLMPSYAVQLSVDDTWAVAGYVDALRLSRRARVKDLPPDVREHLAQLPAQPEERAP